MLTRHSTFVIDEYDKIPQCYSFQLSINTKWLIGILHDSFHLNSCFHHLLLISISVLITI